MTPEELDEARAKEADRLWGEAESRVGELSALQVAARLAREGWTPLEPVDPDILAFREWFANRNGPVDRAHILAGHWDSNFAATYFLAGARAAREQEAAASAERIKELEARVAELEKLTDDGSLSYAGYRYGVVTKLSDHERRIKALERLTGSTIIRPLGD